MNVAWEIPSDLNRFILLSVFLYHTHTVVYSNDSNIDKTKATWLWTGHRPLSFIIIKY